MLSSKKKFLKKVLKGIAIAIIVYLAFSIVTTKIIYDSVFQRYNAEYSQSMLNETTEMVSSRKSFSYKCGENKLTGYLYSDGSCENGLIVFVPGFKAESIEYEGVIYAFVQEGFDIFAFDPTGHGNSEGDSSIGFPQIIKDLEATMDFISADKSFNYKDIFLFGHSRGAYGACCVANNYSSVSAVTAVNGVDTSMDAIMAYSTSYVGGIAYSNYPFLSMYENMVFGADLSGSSAVDKINQSDIPILIIHSSADRQIPVDKYSIYSHQNEITSENVELLLYTKDGSDGHTSILYDENRCPNYDIIKKISKYYKEKSRYKG